MFSAETQYFLLIGKFDGEIISANSELFIIIGRYFFDKNPFIGSMADISVWNR